MRNKPVISTVQWHADSVSAVSNAKSLLTVAKKLWIRAVRVFASKSVRVPPGIQ